MSNLIRFNAAPVLRFGPLLSELSPATDAINSLFGDSNASALRASVRENANAYVVEFDVPGIAKEDINVDVDEKRVQIEVNFKRETVAGDTVLHEERVSGSLTRSFRLPQAVDAEQASARQENGVLTLTLPKKNASAQKRLTIN